MLWKKDIVKAIVELKEYADSIFSQFKSFFESKLSDIDNRIEKLENHTHPVPPEVDIDYRIGILKNYIEERLQTFHKEITDKCFTSLESIIRSTKEISLIENLALQLKDKDLDKLQTTLLQPTLTEQWKREEKTQIDKVDNTIKTAGSEIIAKRKELYDKFLVMQRQKQDTREIDTQIKQLDWVIGLKK